MSPETIGQSRAYGAVAHWSKDLTADELVEAIRAVHANRSWPYVVQPTSTTSRQIQHSGAVESLTARELDVLDLIAGGCTNDDIATQLYLSINSVKTYIRSAYRKIGITRRSQAVLWGVHNLPSTDPTPGHDGSPA